VRERRGRITTSVLLFVVIGVGLFALYVSFGWPAWLCALVAAAVGLVAGASNLYLRRSAR
jgi:ABC-type uncharacterized transport system permease subunit